MRTAIKLVLILCLGALPALAQSNTGRLVGTVSDASGVIPGATVSVKDDKTGKERTTTASSDGSFSVAQLEPGAYTVAVTAAGHKAFTANEVKIDVGREYTLNATLEVGNISESVTVTAGADVINATNAELSNTVSPRQIQELPLNGRNPIGLILLQAGTASNSANFTSINGQRPSATNITRDGLNIQDNFIRANAADFTQQTPTTDDVAEFTVTSQNAGAESGYGASQVTLSTPRGQSEFHGAAFEYNRNSKFGANDFFSNAQNSPRTFRNFNQFGGKLGGPIWQKRNLFFFTEFEKTIDRRSSGYFRTVLTDSARTGLFTYVDNAGVTRQVNLFGLGVTNPTTAPAGSPPPPTAINPVIASRFLPNIPHGNSTAVGNQRVTTGYFFNQTQNDDRKSFTTRVDWDINSRNTINGVYNVGRETLDRPDFGDANGFVGPQALQQAPVDFYVLAWRSTPSARFTNEVRSGYTRAFPLFPETQTRQPYLLTAGTAALAGLITSPESSYLFQGRDTKTYTLQDNAEYAMGDHSLRFGAVMNYFSVLRLNAGGAIAQYTLGVASQTPQITATIFNNTALFPGGVSTAQRNQANALYALLGGIVSAGQETFNVQNASSGFVPGIGFEQKYHYGAQNYYFADQWRVSPRLTLNLGVRYEIYPPNRELNGVIAEPLIPAGSDIRTALLDPNGSLQTAGTNLGGGRLTKTDWNNFAPVLSFAWSPNFSNGFLSRLLPGGGKTVIRGGFRVSYFSDEFLKATSAEGDTNSGKRQNSSTGAINARADAPTAIPLPVVEIPRTYARNSLLANGRLGAFPPAILGVDPNLKVASNQEYSIGIQRELGFQTALEVRYVGAYSHNSTRFHDLNQLDITGNGFLNDFLTAQSNCRAQGATLPGTADPILKCTDPNFNAAIPGSRAFTGPLAGGAAGVVLTGNGSLTNATVLSFIQQGRPGSLAQQYVTFGLEGGTRFVKNINAGTVGLLDNSARYNYNALQVELRRRLSQGFYMQANYTFSKTLSNAPGTDQRRQEFELDANRPNLEYSRADYDQTHVFNLNAIYELPIGHGKRFFGDAGSWLDRLVGGWQVNAITRVASGAPFSFVDPRSTFNMTARATKQPAFSTLSKAELKKYVGVFRLPDGRISLVNPSIISPTTLALTNGPGQPAFAGQVFFNDPAGSVGNVERAAFNGPAYFNVDASLFKTIRITEKVRFQIRAEAFNLLNRTNFAIATQFRDINVAQAFDITSTFSPRVVQFAGRIEF
jgi:hypothetical protein